MGNRRCICPRTFDCIPVSWCQEPVHVRGRVAGLHGGLGGAHRVRSGRRHARGEGLSHQGVLLLEVSAAQAPPARGQEPG